MNLRVGIGALGSALLTVNLLVTQTAAAGPGKFGKRE